MRQGHESNIGEELFIEELGEVRGGITLPGTRFTTLALGEEGTSVPKELLRHLAGREGTFRPALTTLARGEEGSSVPMLPPMGSR